MAHTHDFRITQGTLFRATLDVVDSTGLPLDLTGFDASGRAKQTSAYGSLPAQTPVEFSCTVLLPINKGKVEIKLPPATTKLLPAGQYRYDIQLSKGSEEVHVILQGTITVTQRFSA